jgi:hypothetical protein
MKKKIGGLPVYAWAAIAAGVLLFMYMRSRSSSGGSSSASTQLNTVDPSNPLGLTYAQENADLAAGIDPNTGTTFAAESAAKAAESAGAGGGGTGSLGGSAGSGTDPAVLTALTGISNQLSTLQGGNGVIEQPTPVQTFSSELQDLAAGLTDLNTLRAALAPTPPTATGSSSAGKSAKPPKPPLSVKGAIWAPFGPKKPTAPSGYKAVGLGSGYWEFVPIKRTTTQQAGGTGKKGGPSGGAGLKGGSYKVSGTTKKPTTKRA